MTDAAVETVLLAARIRTLDDGLDAGAPDALVIADGRVAAVGTRAGLVDRIERAGRVVDLGDSTVVPGYVDSHIHPIMGITNTRGAELLGLTDLDAIRGALRAELDRIGPEDWLLGWGVDPRAWGDDVVSNDVLEEIAPGRRAVLTHFDLHSVIASRAALADAGIDGAREFPDKSRILVRDDGSPTGWLLEFRALQPVVTLVPDLTPDERLARLHEVLRSMAETGFTSGVVLDMESGDDLELLARLEEVGDLPLELRLSPWCPPGSEEDDYRSLLALQGRSGRRWRVEGIKFMIDGTVDGGTAWLYEPDTMGEGTESMWLDPDQYRRAIRFFHAAGIPTITHAIGDKGIDWVVETLGMLEPGGPVHRVEHIETMTDDVLDAFAATGATASMQPTHCTHYTRADGSDIWSTRLGPERAARAFRTADLIARGVPLTLGSDWPVAASDARAISADSMLRRPVESPELAPVRPEQAMTARQVLEGFTTEAYRTLGQTGGTLRPGEPATVSVFSADPLTASPEEFAAADVVLTMIRGAVIVDARTAGTQDRGAQDAGSIRPE